MKINPEKKKHSKEIEKYSQSFEIYMKRRQATANI